MPSSENASLHDVLTAHVKLCSQCKEVARRDRPRGLGMVSNFCSDYQELIKAWAMTEGKVNNIVAHDEFGNQAPTQADPDAIVIMP